MSAGVGLPPRVLTGICVLVAGVWTTSVLVDMFSTTYQPDPGINAIFGGTIGTAIALGRKDAEPPPAERQPDKGRRR